MKKVLLTAVAVFAFGFANAQESTSYKPTKGTVTTEVQLVGGLLNTDFDNSNFGGAKFRYFLKDDLAVRAGLLLNNSKEVDNVNQTNTTTDIDNNFKFNAGIEKHFAGTERLSTYAGLDLSVGFGKESFEETDTNFSEVTEQKFSSFGFNIFSGADYYIAKKVFLGVEAGLQFSTNKAKDQTTTTTTGGTTVSVTVPGGKNNGLNTQVFGGVRIGYQF